MRLGAMLGPLLLVAFALVETEAAADAGVDGGFLDGGLSDSAADSAVEEEAGDAAGAGQAVACDGGFCDTSTEGACTVSNGSLGSASGGPWPAFVFAAAMGAALRRRRVSGTPCRVER